MRKLRQPFLCYVHAYDHMKILWIQIQCLVILSSIKFTSSSFWSWPEQYTRYELDAFISHMGPSNHSGHYVCHIRDKQDPSKWVIFNDNKVRTKCWESLLTLSCLIPGGRKCKPPKRARLPLPLQESMKQERLSLFIWCSIIWTYKA